MNTVSLLFAIIAAVCALSAGSADAWWYNEHNRVVFKGLPTAEYQVCAKMCALVIAADLQSCVDSPAIALRLLASLSLVPTVDGR